MRNVVERCFNRLKQFRGLATRFAKRAAYHRAEIILACIVLHLRRGSAGRALDRPVPHARVPTGVCSVCRVSAA
ncbi:hypothetical protein [Nocardia sp. NRRL S-836]|uniref:hypothetical protein n=1 Tax=Nocardia sp. NRRL S-836 TaxID=1519492 RepID=UPI00350EA502